MTCCPSTCSEFFHTENSDFWFIKFNLPRDDDKIISGYFGLVAIWVTQPLCPRRVPRNWRVSLIFKAIKNFLPSAHFRVRNEKEWCSHKSTAMRLGKRLDIRSSNGNVVYEKKKKNIELKLNYIKRGSVVGIFTDCTKSLLSFIWQRNAVIVVSFNR